MILPPSNGHYTGHQVKNQLKRLEAEASERAGERASEELEAVQAELAQVTEERALLKERLAECQQQLEEVKEAAAQPVVVEAPRPVVRTAEKGVLAQLKPPSKTVAVGCGPVCRTVLAGGSVVRCVRDGRGLARGVL